MDKELLQAIALGIVQGLTEFFPISSTAHLILFPWVFGWKGDIDTLAFDVALHGGTLISLLICFHKEWADMLLRDHRRLLVVMAAAIPAGIAALFLHKIVESAFRSPIIIVFSLVAFGLVMLYADRFAARHSASLKGEPSLRDSLIVGFAQIIALVPGVSRSGITMSAGMFTKLTREGAARFSFLVSTPLIGGAVLWEGRKIFVVEEAFRLDIVVAGVIASMLSGLFAIRFLLRFLKTHRFDAFVYYRFALAAIILILWLKE